MRIDAANVGRGGLVPRLESPKEDGKSPEAAKLHKAATGIEASFIKTLLEQMQKGSKMFGEGAGAGIYQDFFNQAVSESMAARSQFGIASLIEKQMAPRLLAEQEPTNPEKTTNGNS